MKESRRKIVFQRVIHSATLPIEAFCILRSILQKEPVENAWEPVIKFIIVAFTGLPNIDSHDHGHQFAFKYFQVS